jgi:phosphoglycerol geranylgeranyltransferase
MGVYSYLLQIIEKKGAGFFFLLDPDKTDIKRLRRIVPQVERGGADAILVGGSTFDIDSLEKYLKEVRLNTTLPVVIFPGSHLQVSRNADAIFFLSLLSGRNPLYLVGEQVKGAPLIKKYGIEPIPCGYILVDGGCLTSVAYISNTIPIPRDRINIAKFHALTAQYFGMKFAYLEAGSGAKVPVPNEMISSVKSYINIPLIVGGGLRSASLARQKVKAGADFVVIGNAFEGEEKIEEMIGEFAKSIHVK